MFPLRSHHLVSRTHAGEKAWQELRLPPAQRKLLGLLRQPRPVSVLLETHGAEPGALEDLVWTSARAGYLRVDVVEPSVLPPPVPEPEPLLEEVDQDKALQDLLDRHRPAAQTIDPLAPAHEPEAPPGAAIGRVSHPVAETPLPAPSPESAAALARALMGEEAPARSSPPMAAGGQAVAKDDGYLIKSSEDLMLALTGRNTPYVVPPTIHAPVMEDAQEDDSLPDIQLDSPYASDPVVAIEDSRADREDTFLRITEVIKSRHAPGGGQSAPDRPTRARGESDVAYAARLHAVEARAQRQAGEQARREEMAARRRQEAEDIRKTSRQGLSDRLRKALNQRDSGSED